MAIAIEITDDFAEWLRGLRDPPAVARITKRVMRLADGNFGDAKPVGAGISELRIHCGPGYRIYVIQRGAVLVILLCGGDKSTQRDDIENAKRIAQELETKS